MHRFATASRFTNRCKWPGPRSHGHAWQQSATHLGCRGSAASTPPGPPPLALSPLCSLQPAQNRSTEGLLKHVQLLVPRQPAAAEGTSRAAAKPWARRRCVRRFCSHRRLAQASRVPEQDAPVRKQAAPRSSHLFGRPEGPLHALGTLKQSIIELKCAALVRDAVPAAGVQGTRRHAA